MLVSAGAKVNDSTPQDGSALVVASASGHEAFATFLLDKDANPNTANVDGLTALHYAILRGLSLGRGVEWYPGNTYLFRPNMPGLVKALLDHGANPNARITKAPTLPGNRRLPGITVVGATPYVLAAASYDANLMRILAAAGADPKVMTVEHSTALFFAAGLAEGIGYLPLRTEEDDRKALEAVKVAVELGNDVNASNNEHQTPLHGAAYVGSDAIVQYLVDKGANVNVKDNSGQTPLSIARCEFPPTLVEDNLRPQFIHESTGNLLVKLGAIPLPSSVPTASIPSGRQ
jgi:ankyrin repeat protein